ncbi:MAG: hypothetical protein AB7P20_08980 [Rhizobiaceae bacterium]
MPALIATIVKNDISPLCGSSADIERNNAPCITFHNTIIFRFAGNKIRVRLRIGCEVSV